MGKTRLIGNRPRRWISTALAAALLLVVSGPADLIGEEYQLQAAKKRRASQLHSWLAVQEGAVGAADVLARSILQEAKNIPSTRCWFWR